MSNAPTPKSRKQELTPVDTSRTKTPIPKNEKFNGWDDTPAYRRNRLQKLAAATKGIVTPSNVVTLAANAVAITGIVEIVKGNYLEGAIEFAAGRSGDYIDGKLARATGTQSWIGEGLDVFGDKLQAIGGLGLMIGFREYPLEAGVPKLASQIAIVGVSGWATKKGADLHPGMPGKIGLGATGASMAGFEAANGLAANHHELALGTTVGSYVLTGVSLVAGAKTIYDYYQEGRAATEQPVEADLPVTE